MEIFPHYINEEMDSSQIFALFISFIVTKSLLAPNLLECFNHSKQTTEIKLRGKSLRLKTKKYGKYTLRLGGHSCYWMAGRVFRVSRRKHHSPPACPCSYCHSSKAYPRKKRIKQINCAGGYMVLWLRIKNQSACFFQN